MGHTEERRWRRLGNDGLGRAGAELLLDLVGDGAPTATDQIQHRALDCRPLQGLATCDERWGTRKSGGGAAWETMGWAGPAQNFSLIWLATAPRPPPTKYSTEPSTAVHCRA